MERRPDDSNNQLEPDTLAEQGKFKKSPTEEQRGSTLGTGCGALFMVPASIVIGIIVLMLLPKSVYPVAIPVVLLIPFWFFGQAAWQSFFGVPNAVRVGNCPHCGTQITLKNADGTACDCAGCRHRLLLKDGCLHDTAS